MNELAALGESLRRDLEDWLLARCASWLPDNDLYMGGVEVLQEIAMDTAALLSACYQGVSLDAWLTAGYLPAERAEFEAQVAAMALADSGANAAAGGPDTVAGAAASVRRARPDPDVAAAMAAMAAMAPRRPDTWVGSDTQVDSDVRVGSEMRTPSDLGAVPAPLTEEGLPRANAVPGAGARPASSGFQRLRSLQELAARAQDLERAERSPDAVRHTRAAPPMTQKEAATAAPGTIRTIRGPVPPAPGAASDAWSGAERKPRRPIEGSPGPQPRAGAEPSRGAARHEAAASLPRPQEVVTAALGPGRASGSPVPAAPRRTPDPRSGPEGAPLRAGGGPHEAADAGASMDLEELRASFRSLMERAAGPADDPWPAAGQRRSRPVQLARPSPEIAANRPGPVPERSAADADSVEPAFAGEPAARPVRAARRTGGWEPAFAAAPVTDDLLPSDIESIMEAIADDLERDFARLYGGS